MKALNKIKVKMWKGIFKMRAEKPLERKESGLKANTKHGRAAKSMSDTKTGRINTNVLVQSF